MAFIRPSLVLRAMLRPEECTLPTAREIKRSYSFIASCLVEPQPEGKEDEGNVMRFHIRMMKPYWDTSDPAARELWDAVMPRWLHNQALNVTTAMNRYNTIQHADGARNVAYDWADFEFNNNATLRVKLNDDNTLSADVVALAEKVRSLAGAGAFGEEKPELIRMPSKESVAAQVAAYEELKQQVAAAKAAAAAAEVAKAGEDAAAAAEVAAEVEAPAPAAGEAPAAEEPKMAEWAKVALSESPSDTVVIDDAAVRAGEAEKTLLEEPDPAVPEVPTLPPFKLDFTIWGLEYPDGRVVEFDSSQA